MRKLKRIEKDRKIILPELYKEFCKRYCAKIPTSLIGTDVINDLEDYTSLAKELLKENEIRDFLEDDDFVFMMHQGYIFWYFKADGTPDPIVYGHSEADKRRREFAVLSAFIKEYYHMAP